MYVYRLKNNSNLITVIHFKWYCIHTERSVLPWGDISFLNQLVFPLPCRLWAMKYPAIQTWSCHQQPVLSANPALLGKSCSQPQCEWQNHYQEIQKKKFSFLSEPNCTQLWNCYFCIYLPHTTWKLLYILYVRMWEEDAFSYHNMSIPVTESALRKNFSLTTPVSAAFYFFWHHLTAVSLSYYTSFCKWKYLACTSHIIMKRLLYNTWQPAFPRFPVNEKKLSSIQNSVNNHSLKICS